MIGFPFRPRLLGLLGTGALALVVGAATSADAPNGQAVRSDMTKRVLIEKPTKALVASRSAAAAGFTNPRVEPGKVRWQPTFAAACAAARQSGKPVLLFQMMGKLDDQFC